MKELLRRLFRSRQLAAEIIAASFFINILSLASPIFVIQILSRYIGYGFDGTLYTLTGGMLIAMALTFGFTRVRSRMAAAISDGPDRELYDSVLERVTSARAEALAGWPESKVQEVVSGTQLVQAAYEGQRITSVIDMPFFLLFILAVFFLSPILSVITLLSVVCTVAAGILSARSETKKNTDMRDKLSRHRGGVSSAISGSFTVRNFLGASYLRNLWEQETEKLSELKRNFSDSRNRSVNILQTIGQGLRVLVYAVGAKQVVMNELSVGALIGVSILAAKALQLATSFMQTWTLLGKARETMVLIDRFLAMPLESERGAELKKYSGGIEFKDMGFAWPQSPAPLFEGMTFKFEPGSVIGITGPNGSGKSTLINLLTGVIQPRRGQILADGVDIRQFSSNWWKKQIFYVPQEPSLLNGTFMSNLIMLNPEAGADLVNEALRIADLKQWFDERPDGLGGVVMDGGRSLPLGIRKRIAVARAWIGQGKLVLLDEPTEALDADGAKAVYVMLNELVKQNRTIVVVSRDPNIMRGIRFGIDLTQKPTPRIGTVQIRENGNGAQA